MNLNLQSSLLLITLAAAPVASADIVVFGNDTVVTDTIPLQPSDLDKIISAMTESVRQQDTQVLNTTLDYMGSLFDAGFIGFNKAGALFSKGKAPEGDVHINVSEFVMPARGPITSVFGPRKRKSKRKTIRMHRGIDIGIKKGDIIRAAFPGYVATTGYDKRGYGYYIIMSHPNGLQTLYAHLDSITVVPTTTLKAGDPIAIGGSSGNSTGPHLHFETRYCALPINPEDIINFPAGKIHSATYIFNKEKLLRDQAAAVESVSKAQ
ncbi:M23 family metallopeptidase [uncultured Duncaniella sp.]|uniref:M23 family metallopeptidase n=1 Tax=uncultured Duncaniella sp. TaxID=2768039 RepID=UPI002711FB20|nr:M23 family metallopeptidase [uncultured Duncaniella sp.]